MAFSNVLDGLLAAAVDDGRGLLGGHRGATPRRKLPGAEPRRIRRARRAGRKPCRRRGRALDRMTVLAKARLKPPRDEPIAIRGARVHNLQGVDCDLPRNRLVVITGPSGSGKSSLAFDTLYAEGQRRYVESLSAYARQFLDQMEKPDVESVTGLSPGHRHRAAHDGQPSPLHRGHRHRDLRPPARALRGPRAAPLPALRAGRSPPRPPSRSRSGSAQLPARGTVSRPRPRGPRPQGGLPQGARRPWPRRGICASASTGAWSSLDEPHRPRPAPQPPRRGPRRPPGPAARRRRSGCWSPWSKALHLARRRRAGRVRGRARSASTAGGWPAPLCDVSLTELLPARLLVQQPLRRLHRLRGAGLALGRGPGQGHPRREQVARRRRHPSLAAPRPAPRARGARRRWPSATASRSRSRSRSCRARRARSCSRATATLPGRALRPAPQGGEPAAPRRVALGRGGRAAGRRRGLRGPPALSRARRRARNARARACGPESLAVRLGDRTHRATSSGCPSRRRSGAFAALAFDAARAAGGGAPAAGDPRPACASSTPWASAT